MGFMSSPSNGGDFDPYLKYNAKAGRWYTKPDGQGAEEYEVANMTAVFDIPNIKTGWFLFSAGAAPDKRFDPSLSEALAKPGENFKRGFELKVFSDKNIGGVREFASTAGAVIDAMNAVYDAYQAAPEAATGKLPVVQCTGVTPITGKHGTNYQPTLGIVAWVDRPVELAGDPPKAPPAASPPPPAPAKAEHAPPPAAAKAPETADVEF